MRKSLFTICLILALSITSANGQILIGIIFGDKVNPEVLQMGFAIGDSYTKISNIEGGEYAHNIALGLDLKLFPKNKLSLHTGVFFSSPVSIKALPIGSTGNTQLDDLLLDADTRLKLSYLSVPLYAKYNLFGNSFSLEGGVNIVLLKKAEKLYSYMQAEDNLSYTQNYTDDFSKLDLQMGIALGYAFNKGEGVRVKLSYMKGLTDIVKNPELKTVPGKSSFNHIFQLLAEIPIKGDN